MSAPAATGEKKIDWERACAALDERGFAVLPGLLSQKNCQEIVHYYPDDHRFRSRIDMSRYSFGQGEYKYFNYPLPPLVQQLRSSIYPHLAALANRWGGRLGSKLPLYPETLADFLDQCHRAGQTRPTPLLLKYGAGDFNCLHQDLYGDSVFPFQLTFFLSQRGSDFTGGEFVLAEQQPRRQSRVEVLSPEQGDAVIFAVHHRPVKGARGYYRANLRHGVSTIQSGQRYTLGIIFHDAK
ncbi:MAG TPA: 2OG-Fe(II) oxygenase [Candidatus Binatia bacterium]|nr:2OG-Fe(II) oxygenase [Candidatus Binatia bacterium]